MNNAPERILVYPYADGYDGDCHVSTQHHEGEERTQYIRADLVPQWQPIETAPRDGTNVWVYYSHEADPYHEGGTGLTPYGTWAECGDFMDGNGTCVAAWLPQQWEATDEYGGGYHLPAYWFAFQSGDYEFAVNPTHWMPIPTPPTAPKQEP